MKKTAVEWLVEQIIKEKGLIDLDIQAAKEMEKEQIMDSFLDGYRSHPYLAEQYYNETYKWSQFKKQKN